MTEATTTLPKIDAVPTGVEIGAVISPTAALGHELNVAATPTEGFQALKLTDVAPALPANEGLISSEPKQMEAIQTPATPPLETTAPVAETEAPPPSTATPEAQAATPPHGEAAATTPPPAEEKSATAPPEAPVTPVEVPSTKNVAMNQIGERITKGDTTVTAEEYKSFSEHKDRERLNAKVIAGNATPAEYERWQKQKTAEAGSSAEENVEEKKLTPQEKMDQLTQDALDGKIDQFDALKEIAKAGQTETPDGQPFTAEQFKKIAENIAKKSGETHSIFAEFVYSQLDKIQEEVMQLAQLEAFLATAPQRIERLRQERTKAQERVQRAKDVKEPKEPEERQKWVQEKFQARTQLLQVTKIMIDTLYQIDVNQAKINEIQANIDRKLGVSTGLTAVTEWGRAKLGVWAAELKFDLDVMAETGIGAPL